MVSSCSKAPIWHILKPPWNCGEPKRSATKLRRNWAVLGAGLISRGKGCENPPDLGSYSMYTVCICMYTMVTIFNQAQLVSGDTARLEFGPQMLTRFDPCRGRKIVLLCTFLLFALPVHPVQLQQSFVLIILVGNSMGQKFMLQKTRKLIDFVSKPPHFLRHVWCKIQWQFSRRLKLLWCAMAFHLLWNEMPLESIGKLHGHGSRVEKHRKTLVPGARWS